MEWKQSTVTTAPPKCSSWTRCGPDVCRQISTTRYPRGGGSRQRAAMACAAGAAGRGHVRGVPIASRSCCHDNHRRTARAVWLHLRGTVPCGALPGTPKIRCTGVLHEASARAPFQLRGAGECSSGDGVRRGGGAPFARQPEKPGSERCHGGSRTAATFGDEKNKRIAEIEGDLGVVVHAIDANDIHEPRD
jgi:hypothetical protein